MTGVVFTQGTTTSFSNRHTALDTTSSPEPIGTALHQHRSPTPPADGKAVNDGANSTKPRYKHSYAGYPLHSDSNRKRTASSTRLRSGDRDRAEADDQEQADGGLQGE